MNQHIAHVAILVDNYDKAIAYYTQKLGFSLVEDTPQTENKRWVLVAPKGDSGCSLLLAEATGKEQESRIGNQTGGRVFLFLHTDNFKRDYENLVANQVKIVTPARYEVYGTVAVFEDMYGNLWDLVEPATNKVKQP